MIHARFTHDELGAVRGNAPRQVTVAKRLGRRRPQLGAKVLAYAPKATTRRGVVLQRATVDCVVLAVEDTPGEWLVTFRRGIVEPSRFLRATPGAVKVTKNPVTGEVSTDGDADYTTSISSGARGEPECVPESWEREVARKLRVTGEPLPERRPWKRKAA